MPTHNKLEGQQEASYEQKLIWVRDSIKSKGQKRAERYNLCKNMTQYREGNKVLVKAYNRSDKFLKRIAKFMAVFEGP